MHYLTILRSNDDDATVKELYEMKSQFKEMEEKAAALREMQDKVEKETTNFYSSCEVYILFYPYFLLL